MRQPDIKYSLERPHSAWPARPLAIFCDIDGTTLSSEQFWVEILDKALSGTDPTASLSEPDRLVLQGGTVDEHLRYIANHHPKCTEVALRFAYKSVVKEFFYSASKNDLSDKMPVASGFASIHQYCQTREIPLVLVTNGARSKAEIEVGIICTQLNLSRIEDLCTQVICSPEQDNSVFTSFGSLTGKPHPWPYFEALKVAKVDWDSRSRVIGVEDSEAGIKSLRAAGVRALGLTSGNIPSHIAHDYADRMIDSLGDLLTDCEL